MGSSACDSKMPFRENSNTSGLYQQTKMMGLADIKLDKSQEHGEFSEVPF